MGSKGDNYSDGYCNHHPETCTCRWKDEPSKKNNMDRQEGYYFVKRSWNTKPIMAHYGDGWFGKGWYLIGTGEKHEDSDFEHINENRIKEPGELPD